MRFRRSPLAAAAVAFAVGIAAGRVAARPAWMLVGALVLLAVLAGVSWWRAARVTVWPVLGVWVVLGMAAYGWQPGPVAPVRLLGMADGLSRTVRGRVVRVKVPPAGVAGSTRADADEAPPWEMADDLAGERGRAVQVDVQLDEAEEVTPDVSRMVKVEGGVRVAVYGAAAGSGVAGFGLVPGCGDAVEMAVRLRVPARYRDPGVFQAADYLAGQGISAQGAVDGR